jgi:hypothetical protein
MYIKYSQLVLLYVAYTALAYSISVAFQANNHQTHNTVSVDRMKMKEISPTTVKLGNDASQQEQTFYEHCHLGFAHQNII